MLCCDKFRIHYHPFIHYSCLLTYAFCRRGKGSPHCIKPYMDITPYNVHTSFDIWVLLADCGDPSLPVNGFVMAYDSTLEGSQIVFQCSPGFVPSQQMMSVCAANGSWTPDPAGLVCRGIWLYCDCLTSSSYMQSYLLSS